MKLATLSTSTGTRVVSVDTTGPEPRFVDLVACDQSLPTSLRQLLDEDAMHRAAAAHAVGMAEDRIVTGRLRPPVPNPGKIICIGLNYRDHARESGMKIPEEPVCFSKLANTIIGPEDSIRLPAVATQVDYEAELVVAIGKRAYRVSRTSAREHVAGYMNGHDVSARDWQIGRPGHQWLLGKSPDTFAPIGPWLVTPDEIPDPHQLAIALRLNGETMQQSRTSELIFPIDELIAYLSQLITLEPGDLIFTGTPPGVGMARKPPVFLQPGDITEVEVAGLGVLRNRVERHD